MEIFESFILFQILTFSKIFQTEGEALFSTWPLSLDYTFEHFKVLCPGDRITGSVVSGNVFNLSNKGLSAKEISVLEKGLAPTPYPINKADLRQDLREFS